MRPDRRRSLWRTVEAVLLAVGVVCLARYFWLTYQVERLETANLRVVAEMLAPREAAPPDDSDPDLIGAIEIPRLRLSAAIRVGDDPDVLAGAIGYLPDTAPPWADGNTALAAHRDRLFRGLDRIRRGDAILVSTRHGVFEYQVTRTFVVDPKDVWVVDSAPGVDLTLLTCYPFNYVGHAPQRFVVRARKVVRPRAATSAH